MDLNSEFDRNEEENLINQIELEMRKIHISVEKLYNNLSLSEINDPIDKCLIRNYSYSSSVLEKGVNDGFDRNEDALKALKDSLQKEVDFLTSDLEKVLTKMNEYNDMFNRIDKNISNLNAMMETAKSDTDTANKSNIISKHIKMRFREEKSHLKTITSSLFSDNYDVQDLIAKIVEHHFTEGCDKYLQLEDSDNIMEQIEVLRRTNLFDINPRDVLQIRLADLV